MNKSILDGLSKFSREDLAEIYNNLNRWEWDMRLGEQPEDWSNLPDHIRDNKDNLPTKKKIIDTYMYYIKGKIGEKEILKHLHVKIKGKTESEFEVWWSENCSEEHNSVTNMIVKNITNIKSQSNDVFVTIDNLLDKRNDYQSLYEILKDESYKFKIKDIDSELSELVGLISDILEKRYKKR